MKKSITLSTVLLIISVHLAVGQTNIDAIRFGSTGDPLNGLTIAWESQGSEDKFSWGYTASLEQGQSAAVKTNSFTGTRFHYAFPSLAAGASIYYQIFDSKNFAWSTTQTYKVASDASDDQFSFTVLGDSRSYPEEWKIIAEATLDTDFTLFMGDIVNDGKVVSDWDNWFDYGAEFVSRELIYHCVGNHDDDNSASEFDNFMSLYTQPGNELYYSFTYGNAVFICLNTEEPDNDEQYYWLLSTLQENADKTWKIVFFHKPFYTAPSHSGEMDNYFNTFWKPFDDYGVDLIFNGHTHNYQRTVPINRNVSSNSGVASYGSADGEGRCQIVAGNAGAPLSDAANSSLWWLDNSVSKRHFCNVDIEGYKLTMKAMDANQLVFDELVLQKTPASTSNLGKRALNIFPNPSDGIFMISQSGGDILGYSIYNSIGQIISEVQDRQLSPIQMQIDLTDQKEGLYFIKIRTSEGSTVEKLIVK